MFPLKLTVLNGDYSTPYSNPHSGVLWQSMYRASGTGFGLQGFEALEAFEAQGVAFGGS